MCLVKRDKVHRALNTIISHPTHVNKLTPGPKKTEFLNSLQNYLYNDGERKEAEDNLAWACGYNMIEG